MIKNKLELKFYIASDRIMNGFPAKRNPIQFLKEFVSPQKDILLFLRLLRKVQYYNSKKGLLYKLISILIKIRYNKISQKLGFSIDYSSFGYGLVIPHYGTIVVGGPNKIGNFAVLHTSTCIAGGGKTIGDGLYLSSGSQIIGQLNIGDNVTVASHSLVIHDCKNNTLQVGAPATTRRTQYPPWYQRDGIQYTKRVELVKNLKKIWNIDKI